MTPEAEQRQKANKRYVLVVVALFVVVLALFIGAGLWLVHSVLVGGSIPQTSVAFETWRDDNRDGAWDASEPSVAYVMIDATDITDGVASFRAVTGLDGRTAVQANPASDDHVYEFTPILPSGYELTTPEFVRLGGAEIEGQIIGFGLALLPGQPTPTPRPMASLTCVPIFESGAGDGMLEAMLLGPDGSIVLSMRREDELRHFAADGTPLPAIPAPPAPYEDRLLFAPDGRGWTWGETIADGLAYLDGGAWVSVAPYEHPGDSKAYTMAVAEDGAVWLGTDIGALRRDPATGQWTRLAADEKITSVIPTAEGNVWLLVIGGSPWELIPSGEPGQFEEKQHYPRHPLQHIFHGAFWQESGLWVVTGLGLTQWVNEAQTWAIYDYDTTDNDLPPEIIWDYTRVADGSLWLALSGELLHAWPEEDRWVLAPLPELVEGTVVRMEAAADDSLWLETEEPKLVYRCTP